ncbi:hypothetical protein GCM10020256_43900 [Streptomyces thermocoprophilus]
MRAVHWIGGPRLGLRQTYLSHLERCGMVHAVAGQMCGVLPTTRYQATDTAISREIRARLDSAIRTGVPPDPRTAALAALAHAVGLGKHLYPGNEGRSSRSRLRDLIRHDPMGGLVAHAVMDVQNGVAAQPRRTPAGRQATAGGQGSGGARSRRSGAAAPRIDGPRRGPLSRSPTARQAPVRQRPRHHPSTTSTTPPHEAPRGARATRRAGQRAAHRTTHSTPGTAPRADPGPPGPGPPPAGVAQTRSGAARPRGTAGPYVRQDLACRPARTHVQDTSAAYPRFPSGRKHLGGSLLNSRYA